MTLTQRDIFYFWLPLVASWLMMTFEGPIVSATIGRLPDKVVMLAAQGVVISLSVFIESPIINLLSTSTALVKDKQSFHMVRRFTIHWMLILTGITFLIGFTPLFDVVVRGLLNVPDEVAVWVRPGMQVMLLFSAAIGWRRFLQGVLIHFDQGHRVAQGTIFRLIIMALLIVLLAVWTDLAGIYVATISLITGIIAEALFATAVTFPLVRNELPDQAAGEPLTYRDLFWFHLPLANTSLLILLVQPLVAAALARLDNPTESLAAWPVIFQGMLLLRAPAMAFPEVVIAKSDGVKTLWPLRRFAIILTILMLVITALVVFTPFNHFYIITVQNLDGLVGQLAIDTMRWLLIFPALWVINSWLRGLLISYKATQAVNGSMVANLVVTVIILGIGLYYQLPGLQTAAIAMVIAALAETLYQAWRLGQEIEIGYDLFRPTGPIKTAKQM